MKLLKNTQSGRSMVEMLGVLAIIGVLSVGGIAGYSKAMLKYKLNNAMDFFSHTIAKIVEMYSAGSADGIDYKVAIPDCKVVNGNHCKTPLGFTTLGLYKNDSNTISGEIHIYFEENTQDSCIAFLSSGIFKNVPNEWWDKGGYINVKAFHDDSEWTSGVQLYTNGSKSEISTVNIADACGACLNAHYCVIDWFIGPSE